MSSEYVTFDYTHKLPNPSFASIGEHAWACGIPVVSQRIDPRSPCRFIDVYDSYLGHLYVVVNKLWRKLRKGKLDALAELGGPETRTFIPKDIFADRFFRWASPDPSGKITTAQLVTIHVLAERAMGGFITAASGFDSRGHLTAEGMTKALHLDLSLRRQIERCPAYVDTPRPDEVDYKMVEHVLEISCSPGCVVQLDAKGLAARLASELTLDPVYGVTKESLEVFWSDRFQGFALERARVQVSVGAVTWVLGPDSKITTPNNENFKYFLARVALSAS